MYASYLSTYFSLFCEQSRLSDSAADAVKNLLPKYAQNDLGNVCSWADRVRFYLHWSAPLHFADTPDNLCNYQYESKFISHVLPLILYPCLSPLEFGIYFLCLC